MTGLTAVGAERFALLLALSLFFGFAFEEFYADLPRRPGGVRTFPLLALAGGGLYLLEPHYGTAFVAGLLVIGGWTVVYLQNAFAKQGAEEPGFVVPLCTVVAYVLGPVSITQPLWIPVTTAVAAVLLIGSKRALHELARRVPSEEIVTAGQFLILIGVLLPLLAGRPDIPYTNVTPFGVGLAVVAVSSISYASYLLQRYVFPKRGVLLASVLGGLYSSTATTVVLARRARDEGMSAELESGIAAATGMMYLRVLAICSIFSAALGAALLVPTLIPCAMLLAFAWLRARWSSHSEARGSTQNPLQIVTAVVFAALLVAISAITAFVETHLGRSGVLGLAAIVGVTDIDPFVLGLAQGGIAKLGLETAMLAVVVATSSNNILKAVYTLAFSRRPESWIPCSALLVVAAVGVALGFALTR